MKKLNQKGFGLVEGLLIFIAVAIIAVAGAYVYMQSSNTKSNQPDASVVQQTRKTSTTPSRNIKDGYLNIKEVGIKIPLGDSIKDITYFYTSSNQTLNFSTASLAQENANCKAEAGYHPLGFFQLSDKALSNPGLSDDQDGELLSHPGKWFIYYHGPQMKCLNTTPQTEQKREAATIALKKAGTQATEYSQ